MVENSGTTQDDSRDAVLQAPDPEATRKNGAPPAPTPSLLLPPPVRAAVGAAKPKGFPVGAAAKKAATAPSTPRPRIGKPTTAAKGGRPPRSPTNRTAVAQKVRNHHLKRSLGLSKMSARTAAITSDGSSNPQCGSQASQVQSDSVPISGSPQIESTNDSQPIEIDDDEEVVKPGSKRKLKSAVWQEFTKVQVGSTEYAKCIYCAKKLSGQSRNGTNHLRLHLKSCVLKKIKLKGKPMVQTSVRFDRTDAGTISVENYTFDQDIARKELSAMIVLHEYPLSMVDHVGFRRFVGALQPLFKMGTRNTIRSDIMAQYELEKKKAIEYMTGIKSRVAITTDSKCEDRVVEVKNLLADLMLEYRVDDDVGTSVAAAAPAAGQKDDFLSSISARIASRRPTTMGFKTELDRYLDEELLDMNTKDFKVLDWWKVAGTRFPTLRKIARDIFAIPVTTVASESAFSTGGRVLSEHRSRLTSKMLEALMCSQDWLRNKYKDIFNTALMSISLLLICANIYSYSCKPTHLVTYVLQSMRKASRLQPFGHVFRTYKRGFRNLQSEDK